MRQLFSRLTAQKFIRYAAVGVISVLLDYCLLLFFYRALHIPLVLAAAAAFLLAIGVNFLLQQKWTFQTSFSHRQVLLFVILLGFNIVFTTLFIEIALKLQVQPEISKLLATIPVTAWNFILFKKVIFTAPATKSREANG